METSVGRFPPNTDRPREKEAATPTTTTGVPPWRRIAHALGEAVLTAPPRRVVALSEIDAEIAFTLGVFPIACPPSPAGQGGLPPWVDLAGAPAPEMIDTRGGPPLRAIARLQPDLILNTYHGAADPEAHRAVAALAPALAYRRGMYRDGWRERVDHIAHALGREERAAGAIAPAEAAIAAHRHRGTGRPTVALALAGTPDTIGVIVAEHDHRARLLAELGHDLSPRLTELPTGDEEGATAFIGPDQLAVLRADLVLLGCPDEGRHRELERRATAAGLTHPGRLVIMDRPTAMALLMPSPLSIPHALGRIGATIAAPPPTPPTADGGTT